VFQSCTDYHCYYHEFFLRYRPFLVPAYIHRTKIKGTKVRMAATPELDPIFSQMPAVEPLPQGSHESSGASLLRGADNLPSKSSVTTATSDYNQSHRNGPSAHGMIGVDRTFELPTTLDSPLSRARPNAALGVSNNRSLGYPRDMSPPARRMQLRQNRNTSAASDFPEVIDELPDMTPGNPFDLDDSENTSIFGGIEPLPYPRPLPFDSAHENVCIADHPRFARGFEGRYFYVGGIDDANGAAPMTIDDPTDMIDESTRSYLRQLFGLASRE
jgi:hypothetical protein